MEPTADNVAPLLARSRMKGTEMEYVFKCPATGFEATGTAAIPQYDTTMSDADYARTVAKGAASAEGQTAAERAAERVLPAGGFLLGAATDLFRWRRQRRNMERNTAEAQRIAQDTPDRMMLEAFAGVADQFTWDGERWIASSR
jgi:hypothetical protein